MNNRYKNEPQILIKNEITYQEKNPDRINRLTKEVLLACNIIRKKKNVLENDNI